VAIYDPDATDVIVIKVTLSEPLLGDQLDKVEVEPQSTSHPKVDITSSFHYAGNNVYIGKYNRNMGYGDIAAIYVTGTDLYSNQGTSDGNFEKDVKPSKKAVIVTNNVFNPQQGGEATVNVKLDHPSQVKVSIYDRRGRLIKVLVNEMKAGSFDAAWTGVNESGSVVASGIYIVTIETDTFTETRKIVVKKH